MHNTQLRQLFATALTALWLTACSHQPPIKSIATNPLDSINTTLIQKSPNDDRQYAALMLPNHLQVVLVSDPSLENSAASLAVAVGSAQDPQNLQGLAHYLEHMLFLGTAKYPEPDGLMGFTQANAGMTNAYTAYDKTNYFFQINAAKFDDALDRFSDYFKAPTFDASYADKERNAVNNEWSMQKKQDGWIIERIDALTGNPQSPRAKFSIGNLETLADQPELKLQDGLKAFYQRYYSANVMRLTLVGKQTIPELQALAEKHFASIINKNLTPPEITEPGLTRAQTAKHIYYPPTKNLKALFVDFPMQSNKSQWRLKANEYVQHLIATEEPGTLCEQLRNKGLAVNVSASIDSDDYGPDGYMRIKVELTDAGLKRQEDVVAAIFAYVELIKRDGLNEKYYRELQAMRSKDFLHAEKPNPLQQALGLTSAQFDLPLENLLNAGSIYERYDEAAIRKVLNQLDTRNVRIWHINNQAPANKPVSYFDGQYSISDISAADYAHLDDLAKTFTFNLPPLNDLFSDKSSPLVASQHLKPHTLVSAPGIEVLLQHPEFHREDKGLLSIEINTALGIKNAKNVVLANLINEVYKNQNATLIDRANNASLWITFGLNGPNSQAIYIAGSTSKHPQLFSRLLTQFANMKFSPTEVNDTLISYKQNLANRNKNPEFRQLYAHVNRLTYNAHWTTAELLAAAEKIQPQDLATYHKAVKQNPLIRVLAVGNYSEADGQQLAATATKLLPGKRLPVNRASDKFTTPKSGKIIQFQESLNLADSALLQAWFREAKSDDEQAQLSLLNAFLANALFNQLRTQEQLAYAVKANAYPVDDVPGYVMVVQSSNSDLTKIKARMDNFRQNYLAELRALDPAKVESTKQAMLASILQKPTNFDEEANLYTNEFWNGKYAFDGRDRYVTALRKVTKDDLVKMYENLLLNTKSAGMLLQIRGTNFKDAPFASGKP